MEWLKQLQNDGHLVTCGSGALEHHAGDLALLEADSCEQAKEPSDGNPMDEIGASDLLIWDVYFADLSVPREM